ncbi:MAG TPA: hypothetical protein VGC41_03695 [Kofleriaceae bacterium]
MERKIAVTAVNAPNAAFGYLGSMLEGAGALYACGGTYNKATILRSTDRGATWKSIAKPASPGLRQLTQVGDRLWIVGEYGCIAYSTDRGETWTKTASPATTCLYRLVDHEGKLWACGDGGLIVVSHDHGETFEPLQTTSTGRILDLFVVDGTLFFLDTTGMIFKQNGDAFEPVSLRAKRPLTEMIVTAKGTWLASGDAGGIFRSTDKGFSWKPIDTKTKSDLEAIIEHKGLVIAVGDAGTVLVSEDDGVSFAPEKTAMTNHLWSILPVDNALFVSGDAGAVWRVVIETGTQPVAGVPFIPLSL